jgi:hypothetical protein
MTGWYVETNNDMFRPHFEEKECAARTNGEEERNKNESYSFMVNFLIM